MKVLVRPTPALQWTNQQRDTVVFVVGLLHSPDEGDEGGSKLGHSVVWPGGEVILCHCQRFLIWLGAGVVWETTGVWGRVMGSN